MQSWRLIFVSKNDHASKVVTDVAASKSILEEKMKQGSESTLKKKCLVRNL
jgi:hypothetical protein